MIFPARVCLGLAFLLLSHALSGISCWSNDHTQRRQAAITRATAIVDSQGGSPTASALTELGDALLRGGRCAEAVSNFERALELDPQLEPYLWQHGIALFFVGRYDDARALFEKHRLVNPHDVENAAWHFLCVAKSKDVDQARKILLPAPGDSRVPMEQVLERLPGGDFQDIRTAIDETKGTTGHASAAFYGAFYIGLIADAEGDRETAKTHLDRAASTDFTYYMADVARVYAKHLQ
ncbi:tetratricopeptide repeat protein [Aporhodopirellula aestuarii]|uniref:Tetratricopeptide repeat protein n=1 Tax=Aporhodopirellula aestuarii TaxID=2950107 RepID=A0ABT0U169_9BACT|nr:tetratricopeptide repeat protein [Aporhodopirellula aestuarii]MCM2370592.1 tetratricopeptide repeat protein [Aporhodopirellula aestuarii]